MLKRKKNNNQEILYQARLIFRIEEELKSFPDKQKVKEFITSLIRNVKGISLSCKDKILIDRTKAYEGNNLTGSSKYILRVVDYHYVKICHKKVKR